MSRFEPTRRQALASMAATAFVLDWHQTLATPTPRIRPGGEGTGRLRELRLLTATPLDEMERFYRVVLELPVERRADALSVRAGTTKLTFVRTPPSEQNPWYHVAFNIPENKLFLARTWLLERTRLKPRRPGPSTHPQFNDVARFDHWNAHAVFFWDPAGNLLEYIARHTLQNAAPGPFTPADVLCASEIGFMADDVTAMAAGITDGVGLPDYVGMNERFHPLGDHHGLIIVFKKGHHWRGSGVTGIHSTRVVMGGVDAREYTVPDHPYSIHVEAT